MFVELMPPVAGRSVLITAAKVGDPAWRDCVSTSSQPWYRPRITRLSVHQLKPPAVPTARQSSKQGKGGANPVTVPSVISPGLSIGVAYLVSSVYPHAFR